MSEKASGTLDTSVNKPIDCVDVKFTLILGVVSVIALVLEMSAPALQVRMDTRGALGFVLTMGYIVWRARRQPEKLDDWGITTPLTLPLLLTGLALLLGTVGTLAMTSISVGGRPSFDIAFLPRSIEYILGAFPQQFVMCSIGLASLATFPALRGTWRLPLAVGLTFGLAHFWSPHRVPGTIVPIEMLLTFPVGFCAVFYFLKFRNILPLTAIHAIAFPLVVNWVDKYL
jgi:hypothetical protein